MKLGKLALPALSLALLLLNSCGDKAEDYNRKAKANIDKGDFASAALDAQKAIQKDANNGMAHYYLGQAALKDKRHPREAYFPLKRAVELMPDNQEALVALGDLALVLFSADANRFRSTYADLQRVSEALLKKNPFSLDGLRFKGSLAMLDKKPELALESFEKAYKLAPQNKQLAMDLVQALLQSGKAADAEAILRDWIQKDPAYAPAYDLLFVQLLRQKKAGQAEELLKSKIAKNPNNNAYLVELASFYLQTKRPAESEKVIATLAGKPNGRLACGQFYAERSDWAKAKTYFEEGLKSCSSENCVDYKKALASVYFALGEKDKAFRATEELLKAEPKDGKLLATKAELLLERNQTGDARDAAGILEQLVKDNAGGPIIAFQLGRAKLSLGDLPGARRQFEEIVRRLPSFIPARIALAEVAVKQAKYEEAIALSAETLRRQPRSVAAQLIQVEALLGAGKVGEAKKILSKADLSSPQAASLRLQSALLAIAEGRFGEADALLKQMNAADPNVIAAKAKSLSGRGQHKEAMQFLSRELASRPLPSLRKAFIQSALLAKDWPAAEAQLKILAAESPASGDYPFRLGQLEDAKGNSSAAISYYEQAHKLAPNDSYILASLGDAFRRTSQLPKAREAYTKALKIEPGNAIVLNNLAMLTADSGGSIEEAISYAEKARSADTAQPAFAFTTATLYARGNRLDEALNIFASLAKRFPNNAVYRYHYGESLLKKGNPTQARAELQAALQAKPSPEYEQKIRAALNQR